MRPKMMMPFDSQPPQQSVRNTPSTDALPAASSQTCCVDNPDPEVAPGPYLPSTQDEEPSQSLPTAHVRPSHPLKSFAVPSAPPPYDSVLPSTPLLSQQGANNPVHSVKTASIGTLGRTRSPMPVIVPSAPEVQETTKMLEDSESPCAPLSSNPVDLSQNYEPDELTKEMAHLEGLMKDLNAITTA
nr:PREDICTED: neogenin-like isoform X4 [Latimeria chalumnae]|eukprot:XP_014352942.1 PREDICTED: neogenin-like isoform X4 [Latimeria chalumnae]